MRPTPALTRASRGRPLPAAIALVAGATLFASAPATAELRWNPTSNATPSATSPPSTRAEVNGFAPDASQLPLRLRLVGEAPEGVDLASVQGALEAAAATWNQVPCASVAFALPAETSASESEAPAVEISFAPGVGPDAERIAWTIYPSGPERLARVVLNSAAVVWRPSPDPFQRHAEPERPSVDLQATLTHELGHVLGLSHTRAHNAATMSAGYIRDGRQRHLSADDKLGLCALFPTEGRECQSAAECTDAAACIEGVCDTQRGEPGDYCAWDLMHCPEFCWIDHEPTGTGYCTQACEADAECPEHFICAPLPERLGTSCVFSPEAELDAEAPGCSQTQGPSGLVPFLAAMFGAGVFSRRIRRRR